MYLLIFSILSGIGSILPAAAQTSGGVRLNQITVMGAHYSYHVARPLEVMALIAGLFPRAVQQNVTHPPLDLQLDYGMRVFELNVNYDPEGGRYNFSNVLMLATENGTEPGPDLNVPGYKVGEVPDSNFGSNCRLLTTCLSCVRQWSLQHPNHLPITIYLEYRPDNLLTQLTWALPETVPALYQELIDMIQNLPSNPLPVTVPALRALEQEVLSVFPRDAVLTPDQVRGSHETLEEAILTDGWPLVDDIRGKVIFVLVYDAPRAVYHELAQADGNVTAAQAQSLYRRLFFTAPRGPGAPDAAFLNDQWGGDIEERTDSLRDVLRRGYITKVNVDIDVTPAPTRKAKLVAAGVQHLVSDFLPNTMQSARYNPPFVGTSLPGAPCGSAMCDPVTANATTCDPFSIGDYVPVTCTDEHFIPPPPPPDHSPPPPSVAPPPPLFGGDYSPSSGQGVTASWLPALISCILLGGHLVQP